MLFSGRGRAGQGQKLGGREGKVAKYAGQAAYCVYQLIEIICYSRGNLDLGCIKFSQSNMLNIHNHDHHYDHNPCSVLSQCNAGPQCCFKGQGTPPGGASIPADNDYTHSL